MINVYDILREVFTAFILAAMWSQYT